jgi:hypothetical protein
MPKSVHFGDIPLSFVLADYSDFPQAIDSEIIRRPLDLEGGQVGGKRRILIILNLRRERPLQTFDFKPLALEIIPEFLKTLRPVRDQVVGDHLGRPSDVRDSGKLVAKRFGRCIPLGRPLAFGGVVADLPPRPEPPNQVVLEMNLS